MSKYRTVKEICELTGLNRKLLHDYDELGIVKPSNYKNWGHTDKNGKDYSGYKLYDEEAYIKLQQIAIFRKLGIPRSEIKKRLNESYDSRSLLDEQIQMLKKEKEEIENLILVAEYLKATGIQSPFTQYYAGLDINELANNLLSWKESSHSKYLEDKFNSFSEEYENETGLVLDELCSLGLNEYGSEKAFNCVRKIIDISINAYGFAGWLYVIILGIGGQGDGELSKEIAESIGKEKGELFSKSILHFVKQDFEVLCDELIELYEKYHEILGIEYKDKRVEVLVDDLKELLEKHFGIKEKWEYEILFEVMKNVSYENAEDYFGYSISALRFYCK